ncbi:hypothetical protein MTO96_027890 [Rhipicephalus appendiculatus]
MDTVSSGQQRRQRFAFTIIQVTVVLLVVILVYYSTLAMTGSSRKHAASPSDVNQFRSFMSELNLCWPEEPPVGVNPLAVLLDLTFNWGLCF